MQNKFTETLKEWYNGNLDLDKKLMAKDEERKKAKKAERTTRRKKYRIIRSVEKTEMKFTKFSYLIFSVLFCFVLI